MYAYAEACKSLDRARVPYIIVGAFGINLYAEQVGSVVSTLDCDLLLPANAGILSNAVTTLRKLGYQFEAGGEPLIEETPELMKGIVRARANVTAHKKDIRIDLALDIAGCRFASLWKKRRRFKVRGASVPVAPLEDLLRSKKLANRPKDQVFLATFQDALTQLFRPQSKKKQKKPRRRR